MLSWATKNQTVSQNTAFMIVEIKLCDHEKWNGKLTMETLFVIQDQLRRKEGKWKGEGKIDYTSRV